MAGLVRGNDLDDCVALASGAGAIAVTRAGAAPSIPAPEEVAALRAEQADALQIRKIDPRDLIAIAVVVAEGRGDEAQVARDDDFLRRGHGAKQNTLSPDRQVQSRAF